MKKLPFGRLAFTALLFLGSTIFVIIATSCALSGKDHPCIVLEEGVVLPAITALVLFDSDFPDGECFAFASDDGFIRVADVLSGRQLAAYPAGEEKIISLSFNNAGTELVSCSETGNLAAFPVSGLPPGGRRKIFTLEDGAICLADIATEKEIARYYYFGSSVEPPFEAEWLCIVPEGFYSTSHRGDTSVGATRLAVEIGKQRYRLDRLSGALFRPDLFRTSVLEKITAEYNSAGENSRDRITDGHITLENLFGKDHQPPLVSFSFNEETKELRIKITEQRGGAGHIALYSRFDGSELPIGLLDTEKAAARSFREKGKTCHEISLDFSSGHFFHGEIGISAFNKFNTVESEPLWVQFPPASSSVITTNAETHFTNPVLKVLFAASGDGREKTEALEEFLELQNESDLFSGVELKKLFGRDFTRSGFIQTWEKLCATANKNDVIILYLRGMGQSDSRGNLNIFPGKPEDRDCIVTEDILGSLPGLSSNSLLILLDLRPDTSDESNEKINTALLRFRLRLGPRAMAAAYGTHNENELVSSIMEGLSYDFSGAISAGESYINAAGLIAHTGIASGGKGILAFLPREDFLLADTFVNTGELKFQSMASGTLSIDQVDKNPILLTFGDTVIRTLPPGNYKIDMTYRNGLRETRTVELRRKESIWVTFNYVPPQRVGDFSGALARIPSGGINVWELNPVNYEKVNQEAMVGMGMSPYYVAFLAGEKQYRDGDYDKAISEYSRSISLKADYADAYVSRGNARRKKGDHNRAIEDYNSALAINREYAEVYNYRGFLYAARRDYRRAVEDYTQAIRYKADYVDAYFNRAYAYGKINSWDLSIADYTQVIRLEPSNSIAYNERGKAFSSKGETVRAREDYAMAERLKRNGF